MKNSARKWHLSIGSARERSANLGVFWSGQGRNGLLRNKSFCGLAGAISTRFRRGETGNGGNLSRCRIHCAGICLSEQRRLERLAQETSESAAILFLKRNSSNVMGVSFQCST